MRKRSKFLPCLVAVGIALAPLPAVAEEFAGFAFENLSVGLEFNYLKKGLDATAAFSGNAKLPASAAFTGAVENSVTA